MTNQQEEVRGGAQRFQYPAGVPDRTMPSISEVGNCPICQRIEGMRKGYVRARGVEILIGDHPKCKDCRVFVGPGHTDYALQKDGRCYACHEARKRKRHK